MSQIPKIIHYCWFGNNPKTELMLNCIGSWKKILADWQFVEWNNENIKEIESPYLKAALNAEKWGFASDYARLRILQKYGGVYFDVDVEVIKPFDEFLENDFFIGVEQVTKKPSMGCGVIGSVKNHKILNDIIEIYDNLHFIKPNVMYNLKPIPKRFSDYFGDVFKLKLKKDNTGVINLPENINIYPYTYFYPKEISINAYSIHHYYRHNSASIANASTPEKLDDCKTAISIVKNFACEKGFQLPQNVILRRWKKYKLFVKEKMENKRIIHFLGIKITYHKKFPKKEKSLFINTYFYKLFVEKFVKYKNSKKDVRYLEIGPGDTRIEGFEGLNIVKNQATDYIADVAKGMPFPDNTFDTVYSSHFLEHIEWYKTKSVLTEIHRILKPNGIIELWVPDGLKIAKAFVDAELNNSEDYKGDDWWKFNDDKDCCIWASGRIFTYGDGEKIKGHWNSHLAIFSERYLVKLLNQVGFKNITKMDNSLCRINSHEWINLGIKAEKWSGI